MAIVQVPAIRTFSLSIFILLSYLTCVTMNPSVFQPNASVSAPVGGSVILECYTTAYLAVAWVWLKQIPGQKLNPIVSIYYKKIQLQGEFVNESRIEFVEVKDTKSVLKLTKLTSRDAAYYHCGVELFEKTFFGGGTYLTVNDAKPIEVIQPPVLDSHQAGDFVTLHCSVIGETCADGRSVYWLRYEPGESHPGIIYPDGDRKNQCEINFMAESSVQNCVYKVPRRNSILSSAEIYYCGVFTCGKLIIGNGIKLEADGVFRKTDFLFYITILLAVVLMISMMVNIIMGLLWKKVTHRIEQIKSTPQAPDTDVENYASLKFFQRKATRKTKNCEDHSCVVYAPVCQTRSVKQEFPHS